MHFLHSAMRVTKLVNSSICFQGYNILISIAKQITDKPLEDTVMKAFDVLCGLKSF